jgi:DNA-directed RNA polymerase subunit RPC12/RpoP
MFKGELKKCPSCGLKVWKLIPFADCDHKHKGKLTCLRCKRKLKKGQNIKKILETGEIDLRNVNVAE